MSAKIQNFSGNSHRAAAVCRQANTFCDFRDFCVTKKLSEAKQKSVRSVESV